METTSKAANASESSGLGDRMKSYEAQFTSKLDPKKPFAIRLDGHKFSSFTRPFKKPYDERIYNAMLGTAIDLMMEFNGATTVYTCSDEITMVYPATVSEDTSNSNNSSSNEPQLMFGGKITKIISLTAAFATMCFNRHLAKQTFDPQTEAKLIEHIEKSKIYFDSRVFHVPESTELVNNLVWRCHYDCRRNSVSMLAQSHFSHKELQGLNRDQLLEKMETKGVHWDDMPGPYKYGSFIKKEKYEIDATDDKGNPVKALRTRPAVRHFDMANCSDENINFVTSKYLMASSN